MAATGVGWDQRAVVLVELRGTTIDVELFEGALQARGWPVLEKRAGPTGPLTDRRAWYTIEARYPGSDFRAASGARERVEVLAEEMRIDLVVESVDLVDRDPRYLPLWAVYRAPAAPPAVSAAPPATRARHGVRRYLAEHSGVFDTGRQVRAAAPGPARALALRPLPGVPHRTGPVAGGGRIAVRGLWTIRTPAPGTPGPRHRASLRALSWLRLPVLGAVLLGAWLPAAVRGGAWDVAAACLALALLVACATVLTLRGQGRRSVPGAMLFGGGLCVVLVYLVGDIARDMRTPEIAMSGFILLVLGYLLLSGIRLLVRQSSWPRTVPWLLPALLPLLLGFFPSLGLTLHAAYLDAFGADLEDVDVPVVWQGVATSKLLFGASLSLVAPALLGYAKHIHMMVRDRWFGYAAFGLVLVLSLGAGLVRATVNPVLALGERAAAAAAAQRRAIPGFYGIEPEWVCVGTTKPVAQVPVDGGVLDPARPYVLVGDAGGAAVLWDPRERAALKVPLAALRLVPTDNPRRTCP